MADPKYRTFATGQELLDHVRGSRKNPEASIKRWMRVRPGDHAFRISLRNKLPPTAIFLEFKKRDAIDAPFKRGALYEDPKDAAKDSPNKPLSAMEQMQNRMPAIQFTGAAPKGESVFVHLSEIWGTISPKDFEAARGRGWDFSAAEWKLLNGLLDQVKEIEAHEAKVAADRKAREASNQ